MAFELRRTEQFSTVNLIDPLCFKGGLALSRQSIDQTDVVSSFDCCFRNSFHYRIDLTAVTFSSTLQMLRLMESSTNAQYSASLAASNRDVTYSCGSCGYDLNLNSSTRNTSGIGSKYCKSIKKGIISFLSIDESRFNQVEEYTCLPYFISKHSWGLFRPRTKLLCRKCGNLIGVAHDDNNSSSYHLITNGPASPSSTEISNVRKYDIRIRSLQPSSVGFGIPLVM